MTRTAIRRHVNAVALMTPLILFIAIFFVWPLLTMMSAAVSDPVISRAFPSMSTTMQGWDHKGPPTAAMQQALVSDMRSIDDPQILGDATRRLNSAYSGFRSLISRTNSAVQAAGTRPVDLFEVDERWRDAGPWLTISKGLSPYTDKFLLAAVDIGRDEQGSIERLPQDLSGHRYVFARTIWIGIQVTVLSIAVGLPYAMVMASSKGWARHLLLAAVLIPMWTSVLVRTASWFLMLQDQGLINNALIGLGITDHPLSMLFNRTGVLIAMTHQSLPLMVLPIYSVLISVPKNLMPAAASLGASPLRAFWRVLLPLSFRGVVSGSLLVFMTAVGYYIVPALVGGPTDQLISSMIAYYATGTANWQMAAALGLILFAITMCLYGAYSRFADERREKA
jgi:putative spermidine/putrescine transport system permease protein